MRFQCILCFTIIRVDESQSGQVPCPNCSNRMSIPTNPFQVGCVIDDFVIEGEIGKGGMATVYRARQLSMDRPVALKILSDTYAGEEKFARNFLKEAKSAARINHPNLIRAIKVGADDGTLFYAMELVKGITVGERIAKENALEMDYSLNIVQQIAEALHVAWTQENLIHRDIKPDNVMLADDGHAKLMDLGIAVRSDETENVEVSGTPKFMSPEQFRGRSLDCRSDIYSLGATLYQMLVGSAPFSGNTLKEIAREHLSRPVTFPDREVLYVPQRVKKLIHKMMAKSPDERYSDYRELLEDVVFIRKRIAPDENMVPSVHTVSFSKYKVMEGLQDSPSEVFRRREEKKRQVEVAREQAEEAKNRPEPVFQPKHLVAIGSLAAVVVILAGLVMFVAWRNRPLSPFESSVRDFLAKDLGSIDRAAVIQSAEAVGAKLPAEPSFREREAWIRLKGRIETLKSAALREWESSLGEQRKALLAERESLDGARARARADADLLIAENVRIEDQWARLEAERTELDALALEVTKKSAEIEKLEQREETLRATLDERLEVMRQGLEARTESLRAAYAKQERQLRRAARAAQQMQIIDLCRAMRFNDARRLIDVSAHAIDPSGDWRRTKNTEIDAAERVLQPLYDSNLIFAGQKLSVGTISSISRDKIRVVTEEDGVQTFEDAYLTSLLAREVGDLITKTEYYGGDAELADFALCWGDFNYALSLSPENEELIALANDCLAFGKHEVIVFYKSGNRQYARTLASRLRRRFSALPTYQEVETELRELFGLAPVEPAVPVLPPDNKRLPLPVLPKSLPDGE